jgi:hypothetical protein
VWESLRAHGGGFERERRGAGRRAVGRAVRQAQWRQRRRQRRHRHRLNGGWWATGVCRAERCRAEQSSRDGEGRLFSSDWQRFRVESLVQAGAAAAMGRLSYCFDAARAGAWRLAGIQGRSRRSDGSILKTGAFVVSSAIRLLMRLRLRRCLRLRLRLRRRRRFPDVLARYERWRGHGRILDAFPASTAHRILP